MKKYFRTNLYNWQILGQDVYLLWVRKTDKQGHFNGDFIRFSYYPSKNDMLLDQSVHLNCKSFDEANFFVSKVLRAYWFDMPEEFCGRYHKLRKLQKLCHSVS
jgi:hypothetical protein